MGTTLEQDYALFVEDGYWLDQKRHLAEDDLAGRRSPKLCNRSATWRLAFGVRIVTHAVFASLVQTPEASSKVGR